MTILNGSATIQGTGTLSITDPRVIEAVGRLRFDEHTFALTVGFNEDALIFGRLYVDSQGVIRSRLSIEGLPAIPAGGTALDLTTGVVKFRVREGVGALRDAIRFTLALRAGILYSTDGSDGGCEMRIVRSALGSLQASKVYSWEMTFEVLGIVTRISLAEFRAVPGGGDSQQGDKYRGNRVFDRVGAFAYMGEAPAGAATSSPGWRVRRITAHPDGSSLSEFADGNRQFDNVWDDRLRLEFA